MFRGGKLLLGFAGKDRRSHPGDTPRKIAASGAFGGIFRAAAAILSAAALASLALAAAFAAETKGLRPLIGVSEKAPAFSLKDLDGKTVSFRPGNGKPTLIVFWSVFCPLCRELAPSLNEIDRRHGRNLRIVGVNLDGKRFSNAIRKFIDEYGIAFPVGLDAVVDDFFVASDPYGVEKTPTAVVVNGEGSVRGAYAAERMREMIGNFDEIASGLKPEKGPWVKK
jgi:thiol-disulfide isomerase/thioredoxin